MENEERGSGSSSFGRLLRRYRIAAGLSQEALADRARMSTNGISALERGYRRTPQRETLALLAGALALDDEQRKDFETTARSGWAPRGPSVTLGPWPDAGIANLPFALTTFVGRERELDEIATLVRQHRMVTLTGAGGIGKTQTALRAGTQSTIDGAVCFVDLSSIGDPSLGAAAIAAPLRLQEVSNRPLLDTVLAYLKNKTLLLILDNCEHVITAAATVAGNVLGGCPRVRILATSREPLRAAGEHCYRLPSLSVPSRRAIRRKGATLAASSAAITLFTDRARAVDHRFELTEESAPIIGEICRRLDGIPLAIELAAARVNVLSVKAIAEKLDDRFRILTGGHRTALPRQQTMRATIDWSYDILAAPEQRVFERLSVFPGGCGLAAATSVCVSDEVAEDDLITLLASLVDKSLLVADFEGMEPRYRLLESFRQYAREKLAARSEQRMVARRYASACLDLVERFNHAYDFEPDEVWRTLAQEELDNWRAVLQWALTERSDILLGQRLVGDLATVWGEFAILEGRRWITFALGLVDEATPMSVVAGLNCAHATVAWRLREHDVQLASSEMALARYRALGDPLGIARAQSLAGHSLSSLKRVAEAKVLLNEARLVGSLGDRRLVAFILRCLAMANVIGGDLVGGRRYLMEALPLYEALGAKLGIAATMNDLAELEFSVGNAELALQHATEALVAARESNDMRVVAMTLNAMAEHFVSMARYNEAEQHAREGLDIALEQQLGVVAAWHLQTLAEITVLRLPLGEAREARTCVRAARILGFVGARLAALGSAVGDDRPGYDRALAMMCDMIGTDVVQTSMAAGAAISEEQAVEEILN